MAFLKSSRYQSADKMSLESIWQRIDRIYCISLEDRHDRQASAGRQFARVGLEGKVSFLIARRHPVNCEQGIFESHQASLKMGLNAGARHMLIFEDDVVFGAIDTHRLKKAIDGFIDTPDWPILHLGCLASGSQATPISGIRRIRYRCLAHAYLIQRRLAQRIVDTPWEEVPYDTMLKRITGSHVVLYPSIAYQSNSPSDNARQRTLDRIRRLFGGVRTIQIVNEHYLRFRPAVIALHVLTAGAVIAWLLA